MLANSHNQDAFADLLFIGNNIIAWAIVSANATCKESYDQHRGHGCQCSQPLGFEPRLPPLGRFLRQARGNLLPYALSIVITRVCHEFGRASWRECVTSTYCIMVDMKL